jgi:putative membrane protein insertion efficiency factor
LLSCQEDKRTVAEAACRITRRTVVFLLVLLIRCYQVSLRPLLIGACKFHPTCSAYGIEALHVHGPWRGMLLTLKRLLRCHPIGPGGYDPVPEPKPEKRS